MAFNFPKPHKILKGQNFILILSLPAIPVSLRACIKAPSPARLANFRHIAKPFLALFLKIPAFLAGIFIYGVNTELKCTGYAAPAR